MSTFGIHFVCLCINTLFASPPFPSPCLQTPRHKEWRYELAILAPFNICFLFHCKRGLNTIATHHDITLHSTIVHCLRSAQLTFGVECFERKLFEFRQWQSWSTSFLTAARVHCTWMALHERERWIRLMFFVPWFYLLCVIERQMPQIHTRSNRATRHYELVTFMHLPLSSVHC